LRKKRTRGRARSEGRTREIRISQGMRVVWFSRVIKRGGENPFLSNSILSHSFLLGYGLISLK
jgi:hypothetical protein